MTIYIQNKNKYMYWMHRQDLVNFTKADIRSLHSGWLTIETTTTKLQTIG